MDQPGPVIDGVDEAALIACTRRDPAAFAPLYAYYVDPVYRYCYRRLATREAAEDATSQVFVKALQSLHAYRDGSFRAWLFTIAQHVVADVYRRQRPALPLDAAGDVAEPALSPEEMAQQSDDRRAIHALLARLPSDQRRVLELRMAGLTGPEIAQVLGRSPGARRRHRGAAPPR